MPSDPDPSTNSNPPTSDGRATDHAAESLAGSPAESLAESPAESLVVATFRDAVGLAMQLADEYAFVSAGVVLESSGVVSDIVLAEGIGERDPAEMFATLAVADDIHAETDGHDYHVTAKGVAEAYSIDTGRARHALKLAGWVNVRGDRWESETGAMTAWTPEPTDMLAELFE